jgi:hypothetical protein
VKGADGQRQAREPLDVGNRLELVGIDQGFFEAPLRDQRQHQALLQRGVTGSEGERLLVVGDGTVEIIVAFGDPRGKIGPRERSDIDWRGGLFGVGGQTGGRHGRHNCQPCQPARTSLPHRIPFTQSHARVSGIAVDSIFSRQSMAFLGRGFNPARIHNRVMLSKTTRKCAQLRPSTALCRRGGLPACPAAAHRRRDAVSDP